MTKDPVAAVAALDAEIEQTQREDKIDREGIVSVEVPEGVEILMDRAELDARINYLRQHGRGEVTDELRRLVSEQSGRDLDAIGIARDAEEADRRALGVVAEEEAQSREAQSWRAEMDGEDEDPNPTGEACAATARLTGPCDRGIGHPGDHRDVAGNEWPQGGED